MHGPVRTDHSVAREKGVSPGDRAFLLRQGRHERGLVASGSITSEIHPDKHWDGSGRVTNYCDVEWDAIVGPDERLPTEVLQRRLPSVHWRPQQSGTEIKPPADRALERLWRDHLAQIGRVSSAHRRGNSAAEHKPTGIPKGRAHGPVGTAYREAAEDTASRTRDPWTVDPDVIDRGLRGHATTQNAAAKHLRELGIGPRSPRPGEPTFDLAWEADGIAFVAEVKSLTSANEEQQLRLGLGQVLRYRQLLRNGGRAAEAYLIVERPPADPAWDSLCQALGVVLTYPSRFEKTEWRHDG